jgi:L-lactate dehydrogenase (cytochrome)
MRWQNVAAADADPVTATSYINSQFDPSATWEAMSWFREHWDGPIVVKGILHPEDASEAVRRGAAAICVSNHGGRQLDHAPSTISALPAIVQAVGGEAEVYLDGGVRRGSDVVKALALGARACLAGRALVYGLGVAGEHGARRAVEILRAELAGALALAGVPSVHALGEANVALLPRTPSGVPTHL